MYTLMVTGEISKGLVFPAIFKSPGLELKLMHLYLDRGIGNYCTMPNHELNTVKY